MCHDTNRVGVSLRIPLPIRQLRISSTATYNHLCYPVDHFRSGQWLQPKRFDH
jgi:hypothetical protein